ncbi:hypothetical protein CCP3SC1_170005 [Gammaproteobacteria bacterium]
MEAPTVLRNLPIYHAVSNIGLVSNHASPLGLIGVEQILTYLWLMYQNVAVFCPYPNNHL